jgi:hypothetical protein
MADDHALQQIKMREKFAELRNAALAELELRGYNVRGKTPAQIRQMLKRRPSKQKSDAKSVNQDDAIEKHQSPSR